MNKHTSNQPEPPNHFHRLSTVTALFVGGVYTLACIIALTGVWLLFGWWAAFPQEWFLATNLVMTLAVFMILLLLQHERMIHIKAIHAKLDELIRSGEAGNHLIAAEHLADEMLEKVREAHRRLADSED